MISIRPAVENDIEALCSFDLRAAEVQRCAATRGCDGIVKIMPMDATQLKRIVIIGTSCSGKTTFARNLAQELNVQHIELDSIHWKPNWTPTPKEEFRSLASAAATPEAWVLDGNYSAVRDILWARATTLIWLNYPFYVVAWRALSRTFQHVFYRQVLYAGNRETFRQSFLSKDSILWWVVKTYRRRRQEYPRLFKEPAYRHLQIIVIASPAEAERFLQNIKLKVTNRSTTIQWT